MSGSSDYDRTPNYNLYKPVPNADNDLWGDHWNANADALDTLIHSIDVRASVTSFNSRTGAVTLTSADVTTALTFTPYNSANPAGYQTAAQVTSALLPYAPLASPIFTGNPTAPTPTAGDNDTSIATTAFVAAAVTAGAVSPSNANPAANGTAAPGTATLYARGDHVHPIDASRAPLASPTFTGNPTAPTPTAGDNDTSIATTAFVTGAVATAAASAATNVGRNYIHNPLMVVAQRGTGPWTATGYTLDRWRAEVVLDTVSITRGTVLDGARPIIGDDAAYNLSATCTGSAAANAYSMVSQRIEDVRRLANKTVTVSFFAGNAQGSKLGVSIDQNFGTSGSTTVQGVGQSVTLGGGWARYTLTFVIASASGKTVTAADSYTQLNFWYSSGADNNTRAGGIGPQTFTANQTYFYGVQLEIGSTATPLEKPDPQQDLAKCQRFFQVGGVLGASYGTAGSSIQVNTTLPVTMRAAPTVTPTTNANSNASGVALGGDANKVYTSGATATAAGTCWIAQNYIASADL